MSDKIRTAGKLLSDFIKQIAQEKVVIEDPDDKTNNRAITKAEALARIIWEGALGCVKIIEGQRIVFAPDKIFIQLIYDRMEGKAGPVESGKKGSDIPKKISDIAVARLNRTVKSEQEKGEV